MLDIPKLPKIKREDIISDGRKALVLVYDKALRAPNGYKKYPISKDGQRIDIKKGGKAHWQPQIDHNSHIDVARRGWIRRWRTYWKRIYIVEKGADSCIDFSTPKVTGPTEEDVKNAAKSELVTGFGKQKQETPLIQYINVLLLILIIMRLFGVF